MRLFNVTTGKYEDVDDAHAATAIASRQYAPMEDAVVPVVHPGGQLGTVAGRDVWSALDQGFRVADPAVYRRQVLELKHSATEAVGVGVLRALTMPLGGGLDVWGSPEWREQVREIQEARPGASTIGEVAGMLVPGQLPAKLGRGVAGVVARAVTKAAPTALERIASRVAPSVAQAAVEGVLYGAGGAASESALANHDLTAEAIVAGAGRGALFGGLIGGALGAIARPEALARAGTAAREAESAGARAVDVLDPGFRRATSAQSVADYLESFARARAVKATGAIFGDLKRLTRNGKAVERIDEAGEVLLRRGVVSAKGTLEDLAARAETELAAAGGEMSSLLGRLDDLAARKPELRPVGVAIARKIESEILAPLERKAMVGAERTAAAEVRAQIQPFLERFTLQRDASGRVVRVAEDLSFRDLHAFRWKLDRGAAWEAAQPKEVAELLRDTRALVEDYLERMGDRAAREVGEEAFVPAWRAAKRDYGALRFARDVSASRIVRDEGNRFFSPSDYGVGIGGALAGAVGGAGVGSLAMAFLSGALHKYVRERGSAWAAIGARKAASALGAAGTVQPIQQAAAAEALARRVGAKVGETTGAILRRAAATAPARIAATAQGRRAARAEGAAVRDPEMVRASLAGRTTALRTLDPTIGQALAGVATRAQEALQKRLPPTMPTDELGIGGKFRVVPDSARAAYERAASAATNPLGALDRLRAGTISQDEIDTVREVYPRLHAAVAQRIADELGRADKTPAFADRVMLSRFTGQPLDPLVVPATLALVQSTFVAAAQAGGAAAPKPTRRAPRLHEDWAPEAERLARGT